jgi:hypothetical protein
MGSSFDHILSCLDDIRIVDTHEHLMDDAQRQPRYLDFGIQIFDAYLINDFISAGLSDADAQLIYRPDVDIADKWRRLAPLWPCVRHTDYARAYLHSIQHNYGIEDLTDHTYSLLTDRIQQKNKPGSLRHFLQDAKIDHCINNSLASYQAGDLCIHHADSDLLSSELFLGMIFDPSPQPQGLLEQFTGITLHTFADQLKMIDWYFDRDSQHAVSIKINAAYQRSLSFPEVSRPDADKAFDRWKRSGPNGDLADLWTAQNFMMHHIIQRAADIDLPVRFHTGYTAVNQFRPEDVSPSLLANLFRKFPNARFSLFHIGYPFHDQTLALAKLYRNVHVDMCWAWIMDSEASVDFLTRFIHTAPTNKLFAFGGDLVSPDLVYGHLRLARSGIARALSNLCDHGAIRQTDALPIAQRILRDNAIDFFKLQSLTSAASPAQ